MIKLTQSQKADICNVTLRTIANWDRKGDTPEKYAIEIGSHQLKKIVDSWESEFSLIGADKYLSAWWSSTNNASMQIINSIGQIVDTKGLKIESLIGESTKSVIFVNNSESKTFTKEEINAYLSNNARSSD